LNSTEHNAHTFKKKDLLQRLPPNIQRELVRCVYGEMLKKVPIFEMLQKQDKDFLMEVYSVMQYVTFEPSSSVVEHGEPATRLLVIIDGQVDCLVESRAQQHHLPNIRLVHGDFIGEFAILGDTNWGSSVMIGVEDVEVEVVVGSNCFCVCLALEQAVFQRLIESYSIATQYSILRYQRQREQHKADFMGDKLKDVQEQDQAAAPEADELDPAGVASAGVAGSSASDGSDSEPESELGSLPARFHAASAFARCMSISQQRAEARAFVVHQRRVTSWQTFSHTLLLRHSKGAAFSMRDLAGKMVQFADSGVFSHEKQVLVSAAQRLSGDVASEECPLTAWKQQQLLKSKMRKVLLDSKSSGAKEAPTLERTKTLSLEQCKSLKPAHSDLVLDARSWRVVGNTPGQSRRSPSCLPH
jgi:CRP-like cAMP-binding protein